jgi:hypothetical protein
VPSTAVRAFEFWPPHGYCQLSLGSTPGGHCYLSTSATLAEHLLILSILNIIEKYFNYPRVADVVSSDVRALGFWPPHGYRQLSLGSTPGGYCFLSTSAALAERLLILSALSNIKNIFQLPPSCVCGLHGRACSRILIPSRLPPALARFYAWRSLLS